MWAVSGQPESRDTSSDFARYGGRGTMPRFNLSLNLSHGKYIGWRHGANTEGEWSSRNHLSSHQVAPTSLADLPITTISRGRRSSERTAEEHRSKVLGVTLKAQNQRARRRRKRGEIGTPQR
ncbi:hypothetical protein E4U19_005406 [Claviceps sp. Clav32 group G5]|nr:hypothetical protein E4U19_005406 [Claviceps sp. Clav32 group G5]